MRHSLNQQRLIFELEFFQTTISLMVSSKILKLKSGKNILSKSRKQWILFVSSLIIFTVVTNSIPQSIAQEKISSNPNLVYAHVKLDGRELFPVAAIAATNSSDRNSSLLPMNMRVKEYEQQLQEIVNQYFNPQTLAVTVSNFDGQITLVASDGRELPQRRIGNVTELDAQIHGLSVPFLAKQWSQIIHSALIQAQQERQPAYIRRQLLSTGAVFLAMMLLCGLFLIGQKRLKAQWKKLKLQQSTSAVSQQENLNFREINVRSQDKIVADMEQKLSLIHISEPTRLGMLSRMPSSA